MHGSCTCGGESVTCALTIGFKVERAEEKRGREFACELLPPKVCICCVVSNYGTEGHARFEGRSGGKVRTYVEVMYTYCLSL